MKKILTVLTAVLLLTSMMLSLAACTGDENKNTASDITAPPAATPTPVPATVTGKWDAIDWICTIYGVTKADFLDDASAVIEFREDGIAALTTFAGNTTEVTNMPYSIDGSTIAIAGMKFSWKISDDVLTLGYNDVSIPLPKVD